MSNGEPLEAAFGQSEKPILQFVERGPLLVGFGALRHRRERDALARVVAERAPIALGRTRAVAELPLLQFREPRERGRAFGPAQALGRALERGGGIGVGAGGFGHGSQAE